MTEKEKAQSGMLYDANYDQALIAERNECNAKCFNKQPLSGPYGGANPVIPFLIRKYKEGIYYHATVSL